MPRFEVRLESQDDMRDDGTPHFRITRLVAEDEAAAVAHCRRKEYELAAFRLDADRLAELEAAEAELEEGDRLAGRDRAHLAVHRQEAPYDVVSVTELEER